MTIGTPSAVAADSVGNVYFTGLNCVFRSDPSGVVIRIAGNSQPGYSGDGGPAIDAQLSGPSGLALDSSGNLFIADSGNYRVRRVSQDGLIVTVAGNGSPGFSGEGGPAVSAALQATGLTIDRAGNLFIAGGDRILKVSTAGVVSTVAGTGGDGFSGDGGPATLATFSGPAGVAVDPGGNLLITDYYNCRVRMVSPDGIITTVAGRGTDASGNSGPATNASLAFVYAVIVDPANNIIFSEFTDCYYVNGCPHTNRIRAVSPNGTITTLAGNGLYYTPGDGGPAINAGLFEPQGLATGNAGGLLIADTLHALIREVSSGGIISTLAGNGQIYDVFSGDGGPATSANLSGPGGMTTDAAGNLFIADAGNNRVRKVSASGIITTFAGGGTATGDGVAATSAMLSTPDSVAVDGSGNVFIAEFGNYQGLIQKVSANGVISTVASGIFDLFGLIADGAGNLYYIAGYNVDRLSPGGTITTVAGGGNVYPPPDGIQATSAALAPEGIAVDNSGNLFIADDVRSGYPGRVFKVSPGGTLTTIAGAGLALPVDGGPAMNVDLAPGGIAIDEAGNLFITESSQVWKISTDGTIHLIAGTGEWPSGFVSGDGALATNVPLVPSSVTVDSLGNVFVCESGPPWSLSDVRILRPMPDSVLITAVFDAAGERANPVSPGKITLIYSGNLGPIQLTQSQPTGGRFPTQVSGTSVTFNGIPAPVLYTSATQVAAIVPYAISGGNAQAILTYQGQASAAFAVTVAASAPSLFTLNQSGVGQAAAINAVDGTVNTATNPVHIGGYISLYATGEGQTIPGGQDGTVDGTTPPKPVLPVSATVGGIPATVQYAGGVPGQVSGLLQVNIQVPNGVQPGGYTPVVVRVGDAVSGPGAWIAVAN
jgi:uncharacterized protein (TIGR03437 family)